MSEFTAIADKIDELIPVTNCATCKELMVLLKRAGTIIAEQGQAISNVQNAINQQIAEQKKPQDNNLGL